MNNHLHKSTEDILKHIKEAGVQPLPRNYFSYRNIGMWLLAVLSIIVGSLAVSSSIFRIVNIPRVLPPGMESLHLPLIVGLMPFLWIALVLLFSFLAFREIRATKRGYRYELSTLVLGLLLASVVMGIMFYATGVGARLDLFTARHAPFLAGLEHEQRTQWMHPEQGFLVGMVASTSPGQFILIDPKETRWIVLIEDDIEMNSLVDGVRVGVRGEMVLGQDHTFRACDIRSLEFSGERGAPFPGFGHMGSARKVDTPRSTGCGDVRPRY